MRAFFQGLDVSTPRILAAFRVLIGLLVLADLWTRFPEIERYYTATGLYGAGARSTHPFAILHWTPLVFLSERASIEWYFWGTGLAAILFIAGFFTRSAHAVLLLYLLGLDQRAELLQSGGDSVLRLAALWSFFLPLARAWSVDSLRGGIGTVGLVSSPALTVLRVQFAAIYLATAINKTGTLWLNGEALSYVLRFEALIRGSAADLSAWPAELLQLLTWSALGMELLIPLLILSPWGRRWCWWSALVFNLLLQGGIAVLADIGLFQAVMIAYSVLLIPPPQGKQIERLPTARLPLALLGLFAFFQLVDEIPALQLYSPRAAFPLLGVPSELLGLRQPWSMFAPDPPRENRWIVIEAVTSSGVVVDPLTGIAPDLTPRSPPPWLGGLRWFQFLTNFDPRERPAEGQDFCRWITTRQQRFQISEAVEVTEARVWRYRLPIEVRGATNNLRIPERDLLLEVKAGDCHGDQHQHGTTALSPAAIRSATKWPIISVLDVGLGDATLIQCPDRETFILIDAGDTTRPGADAPELLLRALRERLGEVREFSLTINTHPHPDHIGGFPALFAEGFGTRQHADDGANFKPEDTEERLRQELGEVYRNELPDLLSLCPGLSPPLLLRELLLTPEEKRELSCPENLNDCSRKFKISIGEASFLLLADATVGWEGVMAKRADAQQLLTASVVRLGHHGSAATGSEEFLGLLTAERYLLSSGAPGGSRTEELGYPDFATLTRLAEIAGPLRGVERGLPPILGCDRREGGRCTWRPVSRSGALLATQVDGTIEFELTPNGGNFLPFTSKILSPAPVVGE
jgi:beta-lactamase superfamily II metal-dependent hydrolase